MKSELGLVVDAIESLPVGLLGLWVLNELQSKGRLDAVDLAEYAERHSVGMKDTMIVMSLLVVCGITNSPEPNEPLLPGPTFQAVSSYRKGRTD